MAQAVNEPMSFTERTRQFRSLVDRVILWARNSNLELLRRWSHIAEDYIERAQTMIAGFSLADEQMIFEWTVQLWLNFWNMRTDSGDLMLTRLIT